MFRRDKPPTTRLGINKLEINGCVLHDIVMSGPSTGVVAALTTLISDLLSPSQEGDIVEQQEADDLVADPETCGIRVADLGDGTPVYCILDRGHAGRCAPLPEGL